MAMSPVASERPYMMNSYPQEQDHHSPPIPRSRAMSAHTIHNSHGSPPGHGPPHSAHGPRPSRGPPPHVVHPPHASLSLHPHHEPLHQPHTLKHPSPQPSLNRNDENLV